MTSSRREAAFRRELGRVESIQGVHETGDISFTARERKTRGTREKRKWCYAHKSPFLSRGNGRNELWIINIHFLYSIQTNLTSKTTLFKDWSVSFPVVFKYLFWMLEKWISVGHFLCTILDLNCFWILFNFLIKLSIMWCWIVYAWNLVKSLNSTAYYYCYGRILAQLNKSLLLIINPDVFRTKKHT